MLKQLDTMLNLMPQFINSQQKGARNLNAVIPENINDGELPATCRAKWAGI